MAITPEMISEKSFSSAFRGYNMDEVDDFLDEIMDEMEGLLAQNAMLREEASKAAPVADNQEELMALRAQISELRAENKALEGEVGALNHANRALSDQVAMAANAPAGEDHTAELIAAKSRIAELEQKIRTMNAARSAMAETVPAPAGDELMQAIMAAAQKKIDAMVDEVQATAHEAVAQIKSDVESAGSEVNDTRSQIHDIRDRYLTMLKNQMKIFTQLGDE